MKKLLSSILAIVMLLTIAPMHLSFAEQTEPSTYWIDREKQDGYLGNYTLISNDTADPSKNYNIGDLTGLIAEPECEPEPEVPVDDSQIPSGAAESVRLSTSESYGEKTKTVNAVHNVGDTFQWAVLDNALALDDPYVDIVWCYYTCRAVGKHCYVWAETHREGQIIRIDQENAQILADEFDRIYGPTINNFGNFDNPAADTKVNILVHNLPDGVQSYFYDFEYYNIGNNEDQYFFHVDNYGTMLDVNGDDADWHVEDGFIPMVSAFMDMLIFCRCNYSNRVPSWLIQTMKQANVNLNYGSEGTEKMIEDWEANTQRYTDGYSLFNWVRRELTQSPAYINVFAEYLKVHHGSYELFGEILDAYMSATDSTGATLVPQALSGTIFDGMTLGEIAEAYRMALVIKDDDPDSLYGFCGNEMFDKIPVVCSYNNSVTQLPGGGARLVKNLDTGIFNPASGASNKIKYVGITVDIDALPYVNCVIFKDYDGSFLKEQLVFSGNDAIPPEDPYHQGMTFAGWDKSYTNIQASVTITATYTQGETYHTVTFENEDTHEQINQIRVIRSFKLGVIDKPVRPGYAFIGWYLADGTEFDPVNTKIYSDMTVYARYISAVTIYSYAFSAWGFSSFSTDNPENLQIYSEADNNLRYLFAGAYLKGVVYGFNDQRTFVKVDPETYESTVIATADNNTSVKNIYVFFDMTYDYSTEKMYVSYMDTSGVSHIGTVNLQTGVVTSVATPAELYMALACTKDGTLYAMLPSGTFVSVNKSNGRYTLIGETGIDLESEGSISYTCMTIDYNTGIMYWSAINHEDNLHHIYMVYPENAKIVDLGITGGNYQLHAMYIPYEYNVNTYYTVNFVDWDGTLIESQQVLEGEDAVAPADPVREGYKFIGWDTDFTNVQSDLRIFAQYEQLAAYNVTFADWDFTVLSTQKVYEGQDAVAPSDPVREGYTFTGWDKDYTNVHSDLIVIAQYVPAGTEPTPTPTAEPTTEPGTLMGDLNGDGKTNTADATVILKIAAGILQLTDEQAKVGDVNRDGKVNTADATLILKYAAGMIAEF